MKQGSNRISSGVIAATTAAFLVIGGVAWLTLKPSHTYFGENSSPKTSTSIEPSPSTSPSPNPVEQTAEIYFLQDTGKNFKLVSQQIKVKADGDSHDQILQAAFQSLLAEPTTGTNTNTIPKGTKLLSVKVEDDSVHVNLSPEFTSGGGSASMTGRVGQIVYTATALKPNAKVYIEVDGKPLTTLGGEGLEIEEPLTRGSFDQNYPL